MKSIVTINRTTKLILFIIVFGLLVSACSKSKAPVVETTPAYQPPPPAPIVQVPTVVAPKLSEVNEAIHRVFKDAAVIESNSKPAFVAGDFNGDAIQDLAVVIKPAPGKLAEMNQEFPPWLLRDPFSAEMPKMRALGVDENEVLLAIIHGYGPNDWRDPQATQTFLLKNAVGPTMDVHGGKEFVKANSGKKLPVIHGDVIEENLRGSKGYLYSSIATYRWFDPNTFKPEPARRVGHPIMTRN